MHSTRNEAGRDLRRRRHGTERDSRRIHHGAGPDMEQDSTRRGHAICRDMEVVAGIQEPVHPCCNFAPSGKPKLCEYWSSRSHPQGAAFFKARTSNGLRFLFGLCLHQNRVAGRQEHVTGRTTWQWPASDTAWSRSARGHGASERRGIQRQAACSMRLSMQQQNAARHVPYSTVFSRTAVRFWPLDEPITTSFGYSYCYFTLLA